MSTKRLNRTILEGGRVKGSRLEGQKFTRSERVAARAQMRRVTLDPEFADEEAFAVRKSGYKEFTDQLAPIWRFLNSKDGEPWSDVKSEITHKFSVQSLSGYHIIKQHMMPEIKGAGSQETMYNGRYSDDFSSYRYYIDDDDIFRINKEHHSYKGGRRWRTYTFTKAQQEELEYWKNGRKIGKVGSVLFWFVLSGMKSKDVDVKKPDGWFDYCYYGDNFRQDKKLNKAEVEYFNSFPQQVQEDLLKQAPVYTEEEEAA